MHSSRSEGSSTGRAFTSSPNEKSVASQGPQLGQAIRKDIGSASGG
jgi:hypothetical protein